MGAGASSASERLVALAMVPGVGPVLARRLLERFGGAEAVFEASDTSLQSVPGIGRARSASVRSAMRDAVDAAAREMDRAEAEGVRVTTIDQAAYPPLLAGLPDAPLVLWSRGDLASLCGAYTVAIVGTRSATAYGIEQAERFGAVLSQAGLWVVSGGARGIDSAAHRAATRIGRPTVAVMGCGLARCYPPENHGLFAEIVERGGVVLAEVPVDRPPAPDQFPARNRVISGLSLGTLVIEAPEGSGALITARLASEEHNREVMALPGRVDSPASSGANALIRRGEAALATSPADVLEQLEGPARHLFEGTHSARFAPDQVSLGVSVGDGDVARAEAMEPKPASPVGELTEAQRTVLEVCHQGPATLDEVCGRSGLAASAALSAITVLEMRRVIRRDGPRFEVRRGDGSR
ncbi:MAG: DNA-processing protein DprA [Planctomycetota bacterium]